MSKDAAELIERANILYNQLGKVRAWMSGFHAASGDKIKVTEWHSIWLAMQLLEEIKSGMIVPVKQHDRKDKK